MISLCQGKISYSSNSGKCHWCSSARLLYQPITWCIFETGLSVGLRVPESTLTARTVGIAVLVNNQAK